MAVVEEEVVAVVLVAVAARHLPIQSDVELLEEEGNVTKVVEARVPAQF